MQGQQDVAVRYVQGLLAGIEADRQQQQQQQRSTAQQAYLQCLAAKWLSNTR